MSDVRKDIERFLHINHRPWWLLYQFTSREIRSSLPDQRSRLIVNALIWTSGWQWDAVSEFVIDTRGAKQIWTMNHMHFIHNSPDTAALWLQINTALLILWNCKSWRLLRLLIHSHHASWGFSSGFTFASFDQIVFISPNLSSPLFASNGELQKEAGFCVGHNTAIVGFHRWEFVTACSVHQIGGSPAAKLFVFLIQRLHRPASVNTAVAFLIVQ